MTGLDWTRLLIGSGLAWFAASLAFGFVLGGFLARQRHEAEPGFDGITGDARGDRKT